MRTSRSRFFCGGPFCGRGSGGGSGHTKEIYFWVRSLVLALAMAGLSPAVTRAAAAPIFLPPASYPAGEEPWRVAVGDFDGVHGLDLAVVNYTESGDVAVLLNQGGGTFAPPVHYAAGQMCSAVAVGDLDRDGDLDLAVANQDSNNVSVLLNQGGGTFAPAGSYPAGASPQGVVAGDLDGDGDLDLAVANIVSDNVSVLLNQGGGTFVLKGDYAAGVTPRGVAAADFDGDGDLDVAVVNYFNPPGVSVLLNQGDGTLGAPAGYRSVGETPFSLAAGDLDGDGDVDLVVDDSSVSVFLNKGDGTFDQAVGCSAGEYTVSLAVGDFDGDGKLDLAVVNYDPPDVSVVLNQGNGTFGAPLTCAVGTYPWHLAAGDLDGDGYLDLAVAHYSTGSVSVLINSTANEPCDFTFEFEGPDTLKGQAGTAVSGAYTAFLNGRGSSGAQAWQLGIEATGARFLDATVADEIQELVRNDHGFAVATLLPSAAAEKTGVISAVIRSLDDSQLTFPPGRIEILKLEVEAAIPNQPGQATLSYTDSLEPNPGAPVECLVTCQDKETYPPLPSKEIQLVPSKPCSFVLELEGPDSLAGRSGTPVKGACAAVLNGLGESRADSWYVGIEADHAQFLGAALPDEILTIIHENAGWESTELVPLGASKKTGVVSTVHLSTGGPLYTLPPGRTTILELEIEATIPDQDGLAWLYYRDDLQGSGQPVKNLVWCGEGYGFPQYVDLQIPLIPQVSSAPDCSAAYGSLVTWWPPSHEFRDVEILGVTDPDGDEVTITVTGVTQDEPVLATGQGAGASCPDAKFLCVNGDGNPEQAMVRSERAGTGSGRTYTIEFTATDTAGLTCSGSVSFCVPHDQSGDLCLTPGREIYDSTGTVDCPEEGDGAGAGSRVWMLDEITTLDREPLFLRGDIDWSDDLNMTDAILILRKLFLGGGLLDCADTADVTDDGRTDITDAVWLVMYLFLGGSPPPEPSGQIGPDPTPDSLGCP